jgi:hypothetical protein
MKQILKNNYIRSFLILVLVLYCSFLRPNLPNSIKKLFSYTLFRIVVIFGIFVLASMDPQIALLFSIAFILTLEYTEGMENTGPNIRSRLIGNANTSTPLDLNIQSNPMEPNSYKLPDLNPQPNGTIQYSERSNFPQGKLEPTLSRIGLSPILDNEQQQYSMPSNYSSMIFDGLKKKYIKC